MKADKWISEDINLTFPVSSHLISTFIGIWIINIAGKGSTFWYVFGIIMIGFSLVSLIYLIAKSMIKMIKSKD